MDFIQKWHFACNNMNEPISQSHAFGLIVNNISQPLYNLISNAPIKSFIDLVEKFECIESDMENSAFDVVINKATKLVYNIIASTSGVSKEMNPKNTKKANAVAANKTANPKKQRPSWSYDQKFMLLEQSGGSHGDADLERHVGPPKGV